MKKGLLLLLLVGLLCPVTAWAVTTPEWNSTCVYKTAKPVVVYAQYVDDTTQPYYEVYCTLPEDTYVQRKLYLKSDGLYQIAFLDGEGNIQKGFVDEDLLQDATIYVYLDDGTRESVPEALLGDMPAITAYLQEAFPEDTFTWNEGDERVHRVTSSPQKDADKKIPQKENAE